ncbi:MAG: aminotransferase class I/II-fold pyridoxal phosphate-dependent enzyme [Acidobacteriota bacterium]
MNEIGDLLVRCGCRLTVALERLDRTGLGFVLVVDDQGVLRGTLTDGDVRRALLRGASLKSPVDEVMHRDCITLPVDAPSERISATIRGLIHFVPLVNARGQPVDYATRGRHRRVPVLEPLLDGNEAAYVQECIESGWVSSQGRFVREFERMIAAFHGVEHALAVANGTVALHLALVSLGIGPGDEVIVPDLTFAATASAVVHCGATPVFVDVEPDTWTIGARAIERALTDRTRAVVPVHLYGHPCDMDEILELAGRFDLVVVEDAAEAFGARVRGRLVGSLGDAACHSFFGNKTLTTGEGGAVLFRDRAPYERAQMLRDHGMSRERRYWHLEPGFNYRLTNLQAAVGVAQLERVETILGYKSRVALRYDRQLSRVDGISLPPRAEWAAPSYWLYTIRLTEAAGLSRDALADRLVLNGIETRPAFSPLHAMPAFARYGGDEFPVSELISQTGLSLPSAVTLQEEDVDEIAARVTSVLQVRRMNIGAPAGE